jgi:8-oxo-dGTP diphosphatase
MGLWNGPGGKLHDGETALDCVRREFLEETDMDLSNVRFSGLVTWETETRCTGMYLFVAEAPAELEYQTPRTTKEGILDWKELSWILHPENSGVPHDVKQVLKAALDDPTLYDHRFVFQKNTIVDYRLLPLETQQLQK